MRHTALFLVLACSFGCRPNFATIDEACDGKVPGSGNVDNEVAVDVFGRINCYRRLARMGRATMDKNIQLAVENHNSYQTQNFVVEDWPSKLGTEETGKPGFTGADPYDRLFETGYENIDRGGLGLWQYIYWDDEDAVSRIDFWFHDPDARQSFLQPAWVGGGYSDGELTQVDTEAGFPPNMAYMNIFYQTPVIDHVASPVIYPKDGQEEVPTGFEAVDDDNVTYGTGMRGYPITVTVGSDTGGAGANAHGIVVKNANLTGGGGPVDIEVHTGDTAPTLRYTVAIYPVTELQPNTTYTFDIELSWNGQDDRSLSSEFTTGPAFAPHSFSALPTARGSFEPPILRHRVIEPAALKP